MTSTPTTPRKLSAKTRALLRRTATTLGDRWSIGGRRKGASAHTEGDLVGACLGYDPRARRRQDVIGLNINTEYNP
jgi:hypothetical protein